MSNIMYDYDDKIDNKSYRKGEDPGDKSSLHGEA